MGRVPRLAICADNKSPDVLLFHCDNKWRVLGCAGYGSVFEAKTKGKRIYPGLEKHWVRAKISERMFQAYLDELFGEHRCSFCNKRADQVDHLFQKRRVRICDCCVAEFHDARQGFRG